MSNPAVLKFSPDELAKIIGMITNLGLYDATQNQVKSTLNLTVQPPGLWAPLYQEVARYIAASSGTIKLPDDTVFWFAGAPLINSNDGSSTSDYIRNQTRYGLLFRNKLSGLTEAQIQYGLQRTSNYIGEKIFDELLNDKGIPDFNSLVSNDINGAIGPAVGQTFEQTIGGWGGTFYYWTADIAKGTGYRTSVGQAVVSGNPHGADTLQQQPSQIEFYYDNSNATADFAQKLAGTALQAITSDIKSAITLSPGDFEKAVAAATSAIASAWASLTAGVKSSTPPGIKARLLQFAIFDLVQRIFTGRTSNPNGYTNVGSVSSDAAGHVTTNYSDGGPVYQNLSGATGQTGGWWLFGGVKTFLSMLPSGVFFLSRPDSDGTWEYASLDNSSTVVVERGSAPGRIVDTGDGNDRLYGGVGEQFVLQLASGSTQTIDDSSGNGSIIVGDSTISASGSQQTAMNQWVDEAGTQYVFALGQDTLTVSGGLVGSGQIVVDDFDLNKAETSQGGFLGIQLKESVAIASGTARPPSFDVGPVSGGVLAALGERAFTVYTSAAAAQAETIQLTLSGDAAGSVALSDGADLLYFSNGVVDVTLAAGQDQVTLSLVDISDPGASESLTVSAKIVDSNSPSQGATSSTLEYDLSEAPCAA